MESTVTIKQEYCENDLNIKKENISEEDSMLDRCIYNEFKIKQEYIPIEEHEKSEFHEQAGNFHFVNFTCKEEGEDSFPILNKIKTENQDSEIDGLHSKGTIDNSAVKDEEMDISETTLQSSESGKAKSKKKGNQRRKVTSKTPKTRTSTIKRECEFCERVFTNKKNYEHHLLRHHTNQIKNNVKDFISTKIHSCKLCSYESIYKSSLVVHVRAIHNKDRSKLSCQFCDKSFSTKQSFDNHLLKEHKNEIKNNINTLITSKIHKCTLCPYETTHKSLLDGHINMSHREEKLKINCNFCYKSFATKQSFDDHVLKQHKEYGKSDLISSKIHRCKACSYETTHKSLLDSHTRAIHKKQVSRIKCKFCDKTYSRIHSLNNHMLREHKGQINESDGVITSKIHACHLCSYQTTLKSYLEGHINTFHNDNRSRFSCQFCDKTFIKKESLDDHTIKQHKYEVQNEIESSISSKIYSCNYCSYETTHKSCIENHMNTSHNEHRLKVNCEFCEKTFASKRSLEDHLVKQHKSEMQNDITRLVQSKIYSCKICAYKTTLRNCLKTHNAAHENTDDNASQISCQFCGKTCMRKRTLEDHFIKRHKKLIMENIDEFITSRIHACHLCSYETTFKSCLNMHVSRSHNDQKSKLICSFCTKAFKGKHSLDDHLLKQHREEIKDNREEYISCKVHTCDICAYETINKTRWTVHLKSHVKQNEESGDN